jgi:transcription initiation factor TFIIB
MVEFVKRCPECNSINLTVDEKRGEIICRSCGFIVDENLVDTSPEWRSFDDGEDRARGGAPVSFAKADMGLSTQIGTKAELAALPAGQRRKMQRMKVWHERSSTSLERNLKYALTELKRVTSLLNIPPSIEEEAARIYNLAVRKALVRGRSMESVVVGAVLSTLT